MNDELQKPPVIDIEAMLQPISDESPSGESLRYAGIYDEITEARREDDVLGQGAWTSDLKTADYRRVIDLAVPALTSQTKDMQIAAWLSEALIRQHGFTGVRDSLKLMAGLQELFWDTVHPEIDEGDQEGRANAISWMDSQGSFALRKTPITAGQGCSFIDYEDSKVFDFPEDVSSYSYEEQANFNELKEQAEKGNRTTPDKWKQAVAATRRAFCEEANFALKECSDALKELNAIIEAKFERNQMPGVGGLSKSIDEVHTQVKRLLEEKKIEEPDPSDFEDETGEGGAEGAAAGGGRGPGGPIQNRPDALKRLNEVADYFQRTEPHSPVAYLAQRAVKWGSMPLEAWLREVVKDPTTLEQIRETLGFNTTLDDGT